MNLITLVISLFVLLFAITIHEAAHGWAAYKFGDYTAHSMGRVTLNPLAHIDPIGTILLPLLLVIIGAPAFGWAKPVPVNPLNLRNPRRDGLWISAAGPASNLTVAVAALLGIIILSFISPEIKSFVRILLDNRLVIRSGFFPMEGLAFILFLCFRLNTYLAIFNLIPVPPLDGSGVLMGFLSDEAVQKYDRIRPYGFLIVLAMIYMGLLSLIISPINSFLKLILSI